MREKRGPHRLPPLCLSFFLIIALFISSWESAGRVVDLAEKFNMCLPRVVYAEKVDHKEIRVSSSARPDSSCKRCIRIFDAYVSSPTDGTVELVLVMERPLQPKVFVLKDPPRVVIDVGPVQNLDLSTLSKCKDPILKGPIRMGYHPDGSRLRIVLDLLSGVDYKASHILYPGDGLLMTGGRFVLTLRKTEIP